MERIEALKIYADELHAVFLHGKTEAERIYCGELEDLCRSEMLREELKNIGIYIEPN